jgi:hypothetical protein
MALQATTGFTLKHLPSTRGAATLRAASPAAAVRASARSATELKCQRYGCAAVLDITSIPVEYASASS